MVKLAFFMLRKGICKKKILLNLNLIMARRKNTLGGKDTAFRGGSGAIRPFNLRYAPTEEPREYEFSCSSTPLYRQYFNKKKNYKNYSFEDTHNLEVINKIMQTIVSNKEGGVRQPKITDSPFPSKNEECCDHHVDQAAEDFIKSFYSQLKEQDC
ncbi:hypothetical protein BVRB_9g221750 [Beta vulgaris subsp. vulgaris]|uniref:uncharacterized protein LOC104905053 n=1 Tax=Beta vulgaris subsp. vulgaris TaxID=3555 RepID=UPI0005400D9B|nr:uncharacterized protein LOC104905053 [Beta vulgaris subsp. vulgaris]KMT00903.1 hypothetical protein BVRB_9g221750 [Beta vulgaris subsp. vulgaris]